MCARASPKPRAPPDSVRTLHFVESRHARYSRLLDIHQTDRSTPRPASFEKTNTLTLLSQTLVQHVALYIICLYIYIYIYGSLESLSCALLDHHVGWTLAPSGNNPDQRPARTTPEPPRMTGRPPRLRNVRFG